MSNRLWWTSDGLSAGSIGNGRVQQKSVRVCWTNTGSVKYWICAKIQHKLGIFSDRINFVEDWLTMCYFLECQVFLGEPLELSGTSSTILIEAVAFWTAMAPSQQSICNSGNLQQTYYNMCGAPALNGNIKKPSCHPTMIIPKGGSLAFINSDRQINQGIRGFSGAATVQMVGQLLFAQCVIPFWFARHGLILKVKKLHFSAHLAF